MSNSEKRLRVWKCFNGNCCAEFVVGILAGGENSSVIRCPLCNIGEYTVHLVKSIEYVITETKGVVPEVNRTGSVMRRPMPVQGEANADTV